MYDRNNIATTTTDNDTEAEKNVNCLRCKYIIEQRKKSQNKAIANLDGLFYVCHRCREKAQRDKKSCQQCYEKVSHARSFFIDSQDQKAQHEGKIEQTKSLKTYEIQEVLKKLTQNQDTDHKEVITFIKSKIPQAYAHAHENGEQNKTPELFKSKRTEREKIISTTNLKPNIDSFLETQLKPSIPKDPAIDKELKSKRQFTETNSKDAPGLGIRFVKSSGQPSGPQIPNNINNINTYVSDSLQTLDMIKLKTKSASEIYSLSFHFKEHTPHILKTSMINESYSEENIISKRKHKEIIIRRRIKSDDNLQKHSHFFVEQQKKKKSSLSSYSSETLSSLMSSEFRYHFLKKDEDKKPRLQTQKSSSELISEVQDLLRVKYEMEIAKEEQRKKKILLEDIKRKRIAQEEMKHETELEKSKNVKQIPLISISSKTLAAEKQKEKDRVSLKSKMSRTSVESEKYRKMEEEKQYVGTEQERRVKEKSHFTAETEGEKTKPDEEQELKKASTKEQSSKMSQLKTFQDIEKLKKQEVMGTKIKQTDSKQKSQVEHINESKQPQEQKKSKEPQLKDKSTQPNQLQPKQKQDFMKPDEKDMLVKISEQVKHKKDTKIVESKKERKEGEKQSKDDLEKKTEQNGKIKHKKIKQTEKEPEPEAKPVKSEPKKEEKSITKELKIDQILVKKPSPDNLISQLVKLRSDRVRDLPQQSDTTKKTDPSLHAEKVLKRLVVKETSCTSSDFELDSVYTESKKEVAEPAEIIIGEKICKYNPPLVENLPTENEKRVPILFQTVASEIEFSRVSKITPIEVTEQDVQKKTTLLTAKSFEDHETSKGIIRYALSDRTYIEKGWTMLPTEKVVRKMNVYRMRPAHPEFDWFEHNKSKKLMLYDSGEKLAKFDDNGRGRWFYRNGRLALDYYDAEENNTQQRIVIYSSGEPDERGRSRPLAILATFDYLGNGIVFDHAGKIRLKYNQTEGIVLDRALGPVSHWKWHTLNDPPVLQQVMIDTHMAHKDPEILKLGGQGDHKQRTDNEEMLAIEFDNFIKEKSKKLSQKFKLFQIKMKALKINEYFSLRVLDQATVYLIYRDGTTNLKLNIGMILDHQEIVDTDTAEVGEVSNSLEKFPARTDSLAGLQKSVEYAQRVERARMQRERRLRPPEPSASIDKLTSVISKPLRPPLPTIPSGSSMYMSEMRCKCNRKPSKCNVYYDTRLV